MSDGLMRAALRFTTQVERIDDAKTVLLQLHNVARHAELNVLGVWRLPPRARRGDRKAYKVQQHPSIAPAFWPEFWDLYAKHGRSFLAEIAWQNRNAFTMTEALRAMKPTGEERWPQHLLYKHGARDVFYIPCGASMVVYWSPKALRKLDAPSRAALIQAACAAAARLRELTGVRLEEEPDPGLSARQRAVLRLVANGYSLREVATHMGIGHETVREHADRAVKKLRAKSLPHAVAEAIRRYVVVVIAASVTLAMLGELCDNENTTRSMSNLVAYCSPIEPAQAALDAARMGMMKVAAVPIEPSVPWPRPSMFWMPACEGWKVALAADLTNAFDSAGIWE